MDGWMDGCRWLHGRRAARSGSNDVTSFVSVVDVTHSLAGRVICQITRLPFSVIAASSVAETRERESKVRERGRKLVWQSGCDDVFQACPRRKRWRVMILNRCPLCQVRSWCTWSYPPLASVQTYRKMTCQLGRVRETRRVHDDAAALRLLSTRRV